LIVSAIRNAVIPIDDPRLFLRSTSLGNVDVLVGDRAVWGSGLSTIQGLPKAKLNRALDYIDRHLDEEIMLSDIASHLGFSQYHFGRLFKQSIGLTPHVYLVLQRVKRAQQLLQETELTVLEITHECGFANPSHFAKYFRKYVGMAPREFRVFRDSSCPEKGDFVLLER
jgi:transcriptional regulator GlxA family with amidase domain